MNALIDVFGSIIAGSVVVLTILTSIFNIQQINYNINAFLHLNEAANHFIEVVDMAYFEPVGRNMLTTDNPIKVAARNRLIYENRSTPNGAPITYTIEMRFINNRNTFIVTEQMTPTSSVVEVYRSPYALESLDIFTYYGRDDNELTFDAVTNSITNTNSVYGVKVDLVFITEAWSNSDDHNIRYPITFWRYFKNIYLVRG